ncbi:nucleotidyltransferase domain-containing protein [Spirosoma sp. BT702]|uniref:Nucleotidyltransferase domain-containing protein n=1 Tax=Spirosoma profusum TaxID=2771354 RepID=A0A926Y1X9_9BACT|nr:nucleotidyltransferase domain-containing protein [Spirosoma profusum]MBD2700386.1 nucleotidyltransferase domain-containing protein [Spirosoma profusum]
MQTHLQPFQSFIDKAVERIRQDSEAVGVAAGGSWATGGMDAYSDLDLVLVRTQRIAPDVEQMRAYAATLGPMIASFRGDHVGELRLLIALYEDPLLHVDIKFVTPEEFKERVENPVILWERDLTLTRIIQESEAMYPPFDFQWTEDRIWIWIHYAALKIGRGEYFEAFDFFGFVRNVVLGPMFHLKNGGLPRGVRRAETTFGEPELTQLRQTVATPDREALLSSLGEVIRLYENLRDTLAPATLLKNTEAQQAVTAYVQAL